jgi:ParB family chromosome partitioning protein
VEHQSDSVFVKPFDIEIIREKNPRGTKNVGFSQLEMYRLREGIRRDGLRHAILVRKVGDRYRLVAGERRLRSVQKLIEDDLAAAKNGEERILCKCGKKMLPASEAFSYVECKVSDADNDREARRQAIIENTMHVQLSDYELLLQVKAMEEEGFTREEQADTLAVSESHISQSHGLLNSHPKILNYIEAGFLPRTAAITFLQIPDDKISDVLDKAISLTYAEADKKEMDALKEKEEALEQIEEASEKIKLAHFTGDQDVVRRSRRAINKANKTAEKADEKIKSARATKKEGVKLSVEAVNSAAVETGADNNLKRPRSMKNIRLILVDLSNLLEQEKIVLPETNKEVLHRDVKVVADVLSWVLNTNKSIKHPLDALPRKKKARELVTE